MTKKGVLLLATAASITLLATVAKADNLPTGAIKTPDSGAYVGGGLGMGSMVLSSYLGNYSMSFPQATLDAGYKFNKYVAAGVNASIMAGHGMTFIPAIAYVKGILPVSDRLNIYAKVGGGYGHLSTTVDHYNLAMNDALGLVGIGENYQLTKSVALGVEADLLYPMGTNWYINDYVGNAARIYIPSVTANLTYYFGS